jgi:hypothetical protein
VKGIRMSGERLEQAGLNRAWIAASAALPTGWDLDGLTRIGGDRWRAWATGPDEARIEGEGDGAVAALQALAHKLGPIRGSVTG